MNILVVSNMYPSKEKPYSGLFVLNQVKAIEKILEKDDVLDFYYMKRTFTSKIGSVIKYIKFFTKFIVFAFKKKHKYDIIHIHYYFPTIYIALIYKYFFNKKVKIVVTFHGFDMYRTRKNFFFLFPLNYVALCIGVSDYLCNDIKKYYKGLVLNISAGVNTVFKNNDNISKIFDLIFVGSFYEEKGFDILCEYLIKTKFKFKICIIGSGHLEPLLERVLDTKKHYIEIHNNLKQKEIVNYLNQSKVLLNLSREESFGLSMAEAMACAIPVIATKTDGSLEQININVNGILLMTNPDEKNLLFTELENAIEDLLFLSPNKLKTFSMNALKKSKKYSLENISRQVIKIYKEVKCAE